MKNPFLRHASIFEFGDNTRALCDPDMLHTGGEYVTHNPQDTPVTCEACMNTERFGLWLLNKMDLE